VDWLVEANVSEKCAVFIFSAEVTMQTTNQKAKKGQSLAQAQNIIPC
jgi:hypothetical protein